MFVAGFFETVLVDPYTPQAIKPNVVVMEGKLIRGGLP